MRLLPYLLLVLWFAPPAVAQRSSLEDLLQQARTTSAAERERLTPEIRELLEGILTAHEEARDREVERLRAKLLGLGTTAGLVLVELLDLPEAAGEKANARADEAAWLLTRLARPPVLPPLLELTRSGNESGRLRALGVLGHWPEPELVLGRLIEVSSEGRRAERLAAVHSLARLGGERATQRLAAILEDDSEPELIDATLVQLGRHGHPELLELVNPVLLDRDLVRAHLGALLDFFDSAPSQMTEERATKLAQLAASRTIDGDEAVELLDRLGHFSLSLRGSLGEVLGTIDQYGGRDSAEAARVAKALLGDLTARRTLVDDYTARIEDSRDPNDFRRYADRGEIYLRLDEPKLAAKDFEQAIDLDGGFGAPVGQDLYIGLARARVALGELRKAAEALEAARLGPNDLERLAADRNFRALFESRYGEVLR